MKKITLFLTCILFCTLLWAQAPQGISHQAVIRNSSNEIVTNSTIGVRVSIYHGSAEADSLIVYRETHTPVSNANGLITYIIGQGVVGAGVFEDIDWSNGSYYLKTEADPTGDTNYTITGSTQILSVPYALHSNNGFTPVYSGSDPRPVLYDDGTIGIGNSTSWGKLNVNGRIVIQPGEATWGSQIAIDGSLVEKGKVYQLTSTGGDAGEGQGKLIIGCSGKGNVMVLDSNLNVGIGTNNPTSKLDVDGEINLNTHKITNVADPVNNNDAVNKAYVDELLNIIQTLQNGVNDVEGNHYKTVLIGTQIWIAENLKTTKYNDNTSIPNVTGNINWAALSTPAYCWYNNDEATYKTTYGAMYNWFTVNTGKLCPTGWHVPSDAEWTTMENYLIANGYNYDGTTTGNKIAKALASASGWDFSSNTGAVGNTDYPAKRNVTGFTALPGGYRYDDGTFDRIGRGGSWWSSIEYSTSDAYYRNLYNLYGDLDSSHNPKGEGISVRCLRD